MGKSYLDGAHGKGARGMNGKRRHSITENEVMARVVVSDGECWNWTGAFNPRANGKGNPMFCGSAARPLVYECFIGPVVPPFRSVMACGNTCCVNPEHMVIGTASHDQMAAGSRASMRALEKFDSKKCKRGHDRLMFGSKNKSGRNICLECARIAVAKRRAEFAGLNRPQRKDDF